MIDSGSKSKATFETVSMFYDQLSYLPAVILSVARFGPKSKDLQSHQHMYCLFGEYWYEFNISEQLLKIVSKQAENWYTLRLIPNVNWK